MVRWIHFTLLGMALGSWLVGVSSQVQAQSLATNTTKLVVSATEVPGEIIVKYKDMSPDTSKIKLMGMNGYRVTRGGHVLNKVAGRAYLRKVMGDPSLHHFVVTPGNDTHALINELNRHPDVAYAEPNHYITLSQETAMSAEPVQAESLSSAQSVSSYSQSSANTKVAQAWQNLNSSGSTIVVAIVDTGIDYNNTILSGANAIWKNSRETPNNGIDDDGNGYVDDVYGWNFNSGNSNPMDDNGHGTHVSGIVVGVGQNIFASPLSNSVIKVMALKFMDASGSGTTANAVTAINYATANGARVINNSWGGTSYSQSLNDALANAYGNGIFIASAAGNYATNDDSSPLYPANLGVPSQISVAASDNYDNLASFSSYGPSTVQVAAPGVSIMSTYLNNGYAYLSGTSMATPFVAGLAALAFYQAPQLTGYQVKNLILAGADPVSGLKGVISSGARVNANNTVLSAQANIRTPASQPSYTPTPPAGVSSGSGSNSSTGCGLVTVAAEELARGRGGSGGGSQAMALLLLPLAVWFMVRATAASQVPYRRKYERFAVNSSVQLSFNGESISGRVSTLSLGGLAFQPEQALAGLAPGGEVRMALQSPLSDQPLSMQGKVVWSENGYAFGVQFSSVEAGASDQLKAWLAKLK